MTKLKLLFVEDDSSEVKTCMATANRYQKEKGREINLVQASNLSDVHEKIDNTFDGAIVDLRLDAGDNGNEVIKEIKTTYRIPIAVMTGTPQDAQADIPYLGVFTKGETGYDELFDLFCLTFDTGITRILGGRGYIEEAIDKVFWKNILPHLDDWKRHKLNGKDTEKALLRFVVNHITEIIDEDAEKYFLEEMYISPVISKAWKTGCIVNRKEVNQPYVILSPACDLALHDGNFKTDRIMVCQIETMNMSLVANARKDLGVDISEADSEEVKRRKLDKKARANRVLEQLKSNNYSYYYHYLPKTSRFSGGFINFRKIETFLPKDFVESFEFPLAQISSAFIKDIISRFSNYYARQGQPDFDEHLL